MMFFSSEAFYLGTIPFFVSLAICIPITLYMSYRNYRMTQTTPHNLTVLEFLEVPPASSSSIQHQDPDEPVCLPPTVSVFFEEASSNVYSLSRL